MRRVRRRNIKNFYGIWGDDDVCQVRDDQVTFHVTRTFDIFADIKLLMLWSFTTSKGNCYARTTVVQQTNKQTSNHTQKKI